jgi:hypothetical protein
VTSKQKDLVAELNQIIRGMDEHTLDQLVNFASICVYVTRIPKASRLLQGVVDAKDLQEAQLLALRASQVLVGAVSEVPV